MGKHLEARFSKAYTGTSLNCDHDWSTRLKKTEYKFGLIRHVLLWGLRQIDQLFECTMSAHKFMRLLPSRRGMDRRADKRLAKVF